MDVGKSPSGGGVPHLDIMQIVSEHVMLRKAGREYFGRCPFHDDKTPSFAVNPDKGLFYCHGCGEGGDAIAFVMKLHGVGFKDACQLLHCEIARPTPESVRRRDEAKQIAMWAGRTSSAVRDAIRDRDRRLFIAGRALHAGGVDRLFLLGECTRLRREMYFLEVFEEDLWEPAAALELWRARGVLENILREVAS